MKTLGATELSLLRGFIRDVLEICEYDDTGVSNDLYDPAMQCAELLGMVHVPLVDEDMDDDYEDGYYDDEDDDEA